MKNVAIVIPPSPWLISDTDLPFLGPLYLSSYLKDKGYDVTVLDLSGYDLSGRYTPDWTVKEHDVFGLTGTSANFPQIRDISYRLRRNFPDSLIIAGGPHATMAPHHMLKYSAVDICVQGSGEKRLENILQFGKSDGTVCWEDEAIMMRARDPISDNYIMSPIPDYEAINFEKYLPSQTFKYLLGNCYEATILTTLGCPSRCRFCAQHIMRDKIRFLPLSDIEKNIDYLRDHYHVDLFYVLDDTFGFAKSRFGDLINLFRRKEIKWHCLLRADMASKERFKLMRDSGCLGIVFGFESGSNKMLKLMNKGVTAQQNYDAAELAHYTGLVVRGQMIVGFPGENESTIKDTKRFIKTAEVAVWGIHVFQPYPGSDVWTYPEKYGAKIDRETDFSDWHTIGKPGESKGSKQVHEWVEELRAIAGEKNIERVSGLE